MENRKDIGKAFREQLAQLDQSPPDKAWDAIYDELHPEKKRRAAWIWFPVGLLLLGFGIYSGLRYFTEGKNNVGKEKSVGIENAGKTRSFDAKTGSGMIKSAVVENNENVGGTKTANTGDDIERNKIVSVESKNGNIGIGNKPASNNYTTKAGSNRKDKGNVPNKPKALITYKNRKQHNNADEKMAHAARPKKSKNGNGFKSSKGKLLASTAKKHKASKKQKTKFKKEAYKNLFSNKLVAAESGDLSKKKLNDEPISQPFDPTKNLGKQLFFSAETDSCQVVPSDSIPKKKRKKLPESKEVQQEEKNTDIYVGAFYGPTYYNSFGGNSIMQNARGYSGKGEIGSTYGAFIRFQIGEKMTLGFGFGKAIYKTSTAITERNANNSFFYFQQIDLSGIHNSTEINALFENDSKVTVKHDFEYFEFPITANYNIYDKTIGIDVVGGMSVYKLMKNDLSVSSATQSSIGIGSLNSIKEVTASLNGGLQFYYNITKKWRIEATPSLRYYLNPTKNAADFKPYSFTGQIGFSYKL